MSAFGSDLREVGGGLVRRARRLRSMAARATPAPLLVRLCVWLAGFAALALTWAPAGWTGSAVVWCLGAGLLPALAPGGAAVTATMVISAGGWLLGTAAFGTPLTAWRLVTLAGALYVLHSAAALAAQLPYDAIVSPGVLLRWAGRTGLVIAGTVVVAVYVLLAGDLLRDRAFLAATLAGFAAAVGVAALLARLVRR